MEKHIKNYLILLSNMSEQVKKYQHWVVIIGTLITIAFTVYSRVYTFGELNNKVGSHEKQIVEMKQDLGNRPTKTEFDLMKDSIERIDGNVKQLTTYLLGRK